MLCLCVPRTRTLDPPPPWAASTLGFQDVLDLDGRTGEGPKRVKRESIWMTTCDLGASVGDVWANLVSVRRGNNDISKLLGSGIDRCKK